MHSYSLYAYSGDFDRGQFLITNEGNTMSSLFHFGLECLHEFFTPHSNFTSVITTEGK